MITQFATYPVGIIRNLAHRGGHPDKLGLEEYTHLGLEEYTHLRAHILELNWSAKSLERPYRYRWY